METAGIDQETLAAFVDGELPPEEMERLAALMAKRPELQSYLRRQERLRADLRHAFADIFEQPVPVQLVHTARTAAVSRRWHLRHALHGMSWPFLMPAGAALAAGLMIGVLLRPVADLTSKASGQLVAEGSLRQALDRQLASANPAGPGPRLGISFRDKAGEDCRTFLDGAASGLACQHEGTWVVGTVVNQAQENPSYSYRMAGSEMPQAVRNAVAASIVGAPFDAKAERAARDSGWK